MYALELKQLCKSFSDFELKNLNLVIPKGKIMGLIGQNGAGKSTTIKLILDILHKDSGSITILGKDNTDNINLIKEDIGVVLDEVGLPSCLNVKQVNNIMKNTFKNWDELEYYRLIKKLSIPENKTFKDFSRGMKMKLGIVIAMSHKAKLLILDEPTSGLDPVVRDEVVEMFYEFTKDNDHSILISSHIVSDLEKLCDYIAFLDNGKLLLCEEKESLLSKYGIILCSKEQLLNLSEKAIKYKKDTPYGIEVIILKEELKEDLIIHPLNIEELFLFMVKERK